MSCEGERKPEARNHTFSQLFFLGMVWSPFPIQCYKLLGGTVQNSLEAEGPWRKGEGPEVPKHCVLIAEEHFLPLAMLHAKI